MTASALQRESPLREELFGRRPGTVQGVTGERTLRQNRELRIPEIHGRVATPIQSTTGCKVSIDELDRRMAETTHQVKENQREIHKATENLSYWSVVILIVSIAAMIIIGGIALYSYLAPL